MDIREQKARQILAGGKIQRAHGFWWVPSQSGRDRHKVVVAGPFPRCTCEDFELRNQPCKHMIAVRLHLQAVTDKVTIPLPTEPQPTLGRKTYRQDWPNYNAAQVNEKDHFQDLLADLCSGVTEPPPKPGRGRRPIPLADAVFSAVFKVYSTVSARRFSCDLEEAHRRGHVSMAPHFNSVLNALENPAVTPILNEMIAKSALPLHAVETDFAVDSSGFSTSRFVRWFDLKYGVTRAKAEWVKVHIACGVKTNVITAVRILDMRASDSIQLPDLVKDTAKGFTISEVSGDKAYASKENYDLIASVGGTGFLAFKNNATGAAGGQYEQMYHYFCLNRETFLNHYHKRSNVESTFSMVKRKFGDSLRSKTDTAMVNETLAKLLCHNLCCLISAWYELGIDPTFGEKPTPEEPQEVLRFPAS